MRGCSAVIPTVALAVLCAPASGQSVEQEINELLQAQAEAFNRGDLDATLATLANDVEWRTIARELLLGVEEVRPAMEGWMSGMRSGNVRLTYPPARLRASRLSESYAVADVVLVWDPGPDYRPREENLFLVLERRGAHWLIAYLRNTTSDWCATRQGECGP